MARCPECGEKLTLPQDLERWDHIHCESCNAELEVLSLRPLELEAVLDVEENGLLDELEEELEDLDEVEELDWDEDDEGDDDDDDDEDEDW